MATPLFRPTIEEAFQRFLTDQEAHVSRTMLEQFKDVLQYFQQYLQQEGHESLSELLKAHWQEVSSKGEGFLRTFHSPQILPAAPGFLQDLIYQQSILPPGMVTNAEKTLHRLGRWLLAQELGSENDYLTALQVMPHFSTQLDTSEELSSRIFDMSRDDPPMGKVLDEVKGYIEIKKVHRDGITVLPVLRNDVQPFIRLTREASALAQPGWWIDARLAQTPQGWQFIDVGNVLP